MIKRRFYKVEHGDKDGPSDSSSSSSSDSEVEAQSSEESGDDADTEVREDAVSSSTSSGYRSEDSSANEVGIDSEDEDDAETESPGQIYDDRKSFGKHHAEMVELDPSTLREKDSFPADALAYVLKCKSVFKCRICPRVVCLNEETLKLHLKSKKHLRSEKLLNEGRLKAMLNSDGEVESQETAAEMHARVIATAQVNPTKKEPKQRRKRFRNKKMKVKSGLEDAGKKSRKAPAKKQRKD